MEDNSHTLKKFMFEINLSLLQSLSTMRDPTLLEYYKSKIKSNNVFRSCGRIPKLRISQIRVAIIVIPKRISAPQISHICFVGGICFSSRMKVDFMT
jgi:hypothetical protein